MNKIMKQSLLKFSGQASYVNQPYKTVNQPTENFNGGFNYKTDEYATYCYICDNRVAHSNLLGHLYFGHVKCVDCDRTISSCFKFSNLSISVSKSNKKCTHLKLDWVFPPVDSLKRLWNKNDQAFDKSLNSYLKTLQGLKNTQPFKKAITYCNLYLKQKLHLRSKEFWNIDNLSSTSLDTNTTAISNASPIHTIATKGNLSSKDSFGEQVESSQLLPPALPENGFYLITKQIIEKCPNCDKHLDPKNLKFNTSNWLISILCRYCCLQIFFILDPPDGSKSKLRIVNSSR